MSAVPTPSPGGPRRLALVMAWRPFGGKDIQWNFQRLGYDRDALAAKAQGFRTQEDRPTHRYFVAFSASTPEEIAAAYASAEASP